MTREGYKEKIPSSHSRGMLYGENASPDEREEVGGSDVFQSLGNPFVILTRLTLWGGWEGVKHPLVEEKDECHNSTGYTRIGEIEDGAEEDEMFAP